MKINIAKIGAALAMALTLTSVCGQTAEEHLKKGRALIAEGREIEAREALRKAVDAGSIDAMYELGQEFNKRGGFSQAAVLFQQAADRGHAPSQVEVGLLFQLADEGTVATEWFEKAAKQGNGDGAFQYAASLATGQGGIRDEKLAFQWYVKAAEAGNLNGIELVALAYSQGGHGLTAEDLGSPKALEWIKKGAENDFIVPLERLVVIYQNGLHGVAADPAKAKELQIRLVRLRGEVETKKRRKSR